MATGTASMLRARRRDVNVKPNRRLDRKSSRGMLYENEELRLRTIHINAEVERGQNDIKKLRRENEQLRREIWGLREEYDRLEALLRGAAAASASGTHYEDLDFASDFYDDREGCNTNIVENEQNLHNITCIKFRRSKSSSKVEFDNLSIVDEELNASTPEKIDKVNECIRNELHCEGGHIKSNVESVFPEVDLESSPNNSLSEATNIPETCKDKNFCSPSFEVPTMLEVHRNNVWCHSMYSMNAYDIQRTVHHERELDTEKEHGNGRKYLFSNSQPGLAQIDDLVEHDLELKKPTLEDGMSESDSEKANLLNMSNRNKQENVRMTKQSHFVQKNGYYSQRTYTVSKIGEPIACSSKSLFPEGGNLDELLNDVHENSAQAKSYDSLQFLLNDTNQDFWNSNSPYSFHPFNQLKAPAPVIELPEERDDPSSKDGLQPMSHHTRESEDYHNSKRHWQGNNNYLQDSADKITDKSPGQWPSRLIIPMEEKDLNSNASPWRSMKPINKESKTLTDNQMKRLSKSLVNISVHEGTELKKRASFPPMKDKKNCDYFTNDTCAIESIMKQKLKKNKTNADGAFGRFWTGGERKSFPRQNIHSDSISKAENGAFEKLTRAEKERGVEERTKKTASEDVVLKPSVSGDRLRQRDEAPEVPKYVVNLSSPSNLNRQRFQNENYPLNPVLQRQCEETKNTVQFSRRCRAQEHYEPEEGPPEATYRYIQAFSKTNQKCCGNESHFQTLHKMSVIVGDTQQGRSLFMDHSLSASSWQNSVSREPGVGANHVSVCSNSQRKLGFCVKKNVTPAEAAEARRGLAPPGAGFARGLAGPGPRALPVAVDAAAAGVCASTRAWERSHSTGSAASLRRHLHTGTAPAAEASERLPREEDVPWCGCWGNGCL